MSPHVFFILLFNKFEFADFGGNYSTEFRFESPISISKWNNSLDFRRKSENYFKVKIFSDSRPKSAQKLILKVFSDFSTQIICRLSKFFKIKIWECICAGTGLLFASLLARPKIVRLKGKPDCWSLYGLFLGFWPVCTRFVCPYFGRSKIRTWLIYSVRVI